MRGEQDSLGTLQREKDPLFLSVIKPYKPVSSATIARWLSLLCRRQGSIPQSSKHTLPEQHQLRLLHWQGLINGHYEFCRLVPRVYIERYYHKPIVVSSMGNSVFSGHSEVGIHFRALNIHCHVHSPSTM